MSQVPIYAAAREFAFDAHEGQMYGDKPYITHVLAVVAVARDFRIDLLGDEYIQACFLHDVVEDTDIGVDEISEKFGPRVAELVAAVSCVKGLTRKEKFKEAYPRIRATKGAVLVKLCDRIANVRSSISKGGSLLSMYTKEYGEFRVQLMDSEDTVARPLWAELDQLLGFEGA